MSKQRDYVYPVRLSEDEMDDLRFIIEQVEQVSGIDVTLADAIRLSVRNEAARRREANKKTSRK